MNTGPDLDGFLGSVTLSSVSQTQSELDAETEPVQNHPERNLPGGEGGPRARLGLGQPRR